MPNLPASKGLESERAAAEQILKAGRCSASENPGRREVGERRIVIRPAVRRMKTAVNRETKRRDWTQWQKTHHSQLRFGAPRIRNGDAANFVFRSIPLQHVEH